MKKRAVTPLISSLLLIFFAIALGVLVMSWGKTEQQVSGLCDRVSLSVISIGDTLQACYKDERAYLTVENNGKLKLSGVKVSVIGSNGIAQTELDSTIDVAGIKRLEVSYKADVGNIVQLRLAPKSSLTEVCANNIFKVDNIRECS